MRGFCLGPMDYASFSRIRAELPNAPHMLFYEPLFLVFFPVLYAIYLAAPDGSHARKWILLAGSALFYTWGEPLFVLVLLVSVALDYRLSLHLAPETSSATRRRLLLTIGVA